MNCNLKDATKDLLRASKRDSPCQTRSNTRKVMKTLRRFIEEDEGRFWRGCRIAAVAKQKFLLNRLMQKKILPEDNDEEEGNEEELEFLM